VSTVVWRFSDGRPGHDVQSLGLVRALQAHTALHCFTLPVQDTGSALRLWLSGRYPRGAALPAPHLLLGAGHKTHFHLLAARRRWGGRIILCMKPSLPLSWFDLCLVPEHDAPPRAANVLVTTGVLNTVQPGGRHAADTGLIVLGGPARHVRWNDDDILEQIERLLAARPCRHWLLATSPRTPASLTERLVGRCEFEYLPYRYAEQGRLAQCMADAGEVWVSRDSVSMLYEALTSGARVGLLNVPCVAGSRVNAAVDALVERGWLGRPGHWQPGSGPEQPLNEAHRCADWVRRQWLRVP
jgi:mitochondrial fission protein ELM1